jgi:hypothetical protein
MLNVVGIYIAKNLLAKLFNIFPVKSSNTINTLILLNIEKQQHNSLPFLMKFLGK